MDCKHCHAPGAQKRGKGRNGNKQVFQCTSNKCRKYFSVPIGIPDEWKEPGESSRVEYGKGFVNITCASKRLLSLDDILTQYQINRSEWEVDRFVIKSSEGYRKERKVDWHVRDGKVESGDVEDTGKMFVVPLYHMEVHLIHKTKEVATQRTFECLVEQAKLFAPKYPKLIYPAYPDGMMLEVSMPDLHFGRLTWNSESGEDYDVKIAAKVARKVLTELLGYMQPFHLDKILLILGNDYFNVNSKDNTTVNGTKQQEDTRGQKTFTLGLNLATEMIDSCSTLAPVEVLIVPGNHDEEKSFYLGKALECWYHTCPNVKIDNRPILRKYYAYGKVLLGFTHGDKEKLEKLFGIMPIEAKDLWGKAEFREWHTGHWHRKKELRLELEEDLGIVWRSLRSLVAADAWTFNSGFVGAQRAAEAFLWDKERGLIAQYTASPN